MADPTIPPALSATAWQQYRYARDNLAPQTSSELHAVAAMALFEQPFGFTQTDVDDEEQVAAYCAQMAGQLEANGDTASAATFRMLGGRHVIRAAKIAALLPPR